MAFTSFATTVALPGAAAAVTYAAVDAANGNTIVNNGKVSIRVKNASGVSVTVTVVSVPDEHGRSGDIVQAIAAGAEYVFGLLDPALFNQRSGDVGQVHVTFSAGTSVTMAAIQHG